MAGFAGELVHHPSFVKGCDMGPFCQRQVLKMDFTKKCGRPTLPAAERISPWTMKWGSVLPSSVQPLCRALVRIHWAEAASCLVSCICILLNLLGDEGWRWCPWNGVDTLLGYTVGPWTTEIWTMQVPYTLTIFQYLLQYHRICVWLKPWKQNRGYFQLDRDSLPLTASPSLSNIV